MLYGNMREAISGKITLPDICSATFRIVLRFIYSGDIATYLPLVLNDMVDVYKASVFFFLPELGKLALSNIQKTDCLEETGFALNKAAEDVPPSDINEGLYDILTEPFRTQLINQELPNLLSAEALEALLVHQKNFEITEFDLLVNVVRWALYDGKSELSNPTHHKILNHIYESDVLYLPYHDLDVGEQSLASISRMLPHIKLELICPHRLAMLSKLIHGLMAQSPISSVPFDHASTNTHCYPGHPSWKRENPIRSRSARSADQASQPRSSLFSFFAPRSPTRSTRSTYWNPYRSNHEL
ncbi:hypothetical protein BC936DRAFT_148670 [Jimgerdemannia flammicorona]|uniref:BTB domain-containing protein n=1 Tax=Jimgerdemannia flammicorona TaxID=994334 RepID=A0A433DKD5_9FUNG|nr:hypothetical protein BC936DRAFT_148670 [Jimgerdemannia flammicorona]